MRRQDREMSREFGLAVIDSAPYGVMGLVDQNGCPYTVPLSLVRYGEALYFHSATSGKKKDAIDHHPVVSLSFVSQVEAPQLFSEEQVQRLIEHKQNGELASKVFTTTFASAWVLGTIALVTDEQEKSLALKLLCERFTPRYAPYCEKVIESSLNLVDIYKVTIQQLTAKRKAFGAQGQELKWQARDQQGVGVFSF